MLTPEQKLDFYHYVKNKVKKTGCTEASAIKEYETYRGLTNLGKTELRDLYSNLKEAFAKNPNYVPANRGSYRRQPTPAVNYDDMTYGDMKDMIAKLSEELAKERTANANLTGKLKETEDKLADYQGIEDLYREQRARMKDLKEFLDQMDRGPVYRTGKDGFVEKVG